MCHECEEFFENENNLRMHKQRHQPRELYCYSRYCDRAFKTFSGMLIHLESGSCPCGIDAYEVRDLVCRYHTSDDFTDMDGYFCPDCYRVFPKLSALYQHVEDTPCSYLLDWSESLSRMERALEDDIYWGQW